MIPFPVKILAIIFIVLGAAGWGYMKGSAHAEIELANYQAKAEKQISDLKTENARISDNVQIEYVDKVQTIYDKETVYREKLGKLADPDAVLASDLSPSGVMDNAALAVVLTNYRVAHENKQQLISLQKWITENRAAIEAANLKAPKEK